MEGLKNKGRYVFNAEKNFSDPLERDFKQAQVN